EDNLIKQGMKFEDYLSHIKKSEGELRLDFTPDAIKRVKTALLIRAIAKKENITVTCDEIHAEQDRAFAGYKMNPAYAEHLDELDKSLHSDHAHHYFENLITNKKTFEKLKELLVK
ncbi:hypothetical protein KKC32_02115, partial [Patescibacteria group bacterium]|nr:hypothetical protein [Patescibacteria group bacterium]